MVVDFGCGAGAEAIELARHGAAQVYGIDILERSLVAAREHAAKAKCQNVKFGRMPPEVADVIVSIDAFAALCRSRRRAQRDGWNAQAKRLRACLFGLTWYHPLGGHLFSVFPWAHLIFGEKALCRWRSHIRQDGAQKFSEVEGGLNQMTIRRLYRLWNRVLFSLTGSRQFRFVSRARYIIILPASS